VAWKEVRPFEWPGLSEQERIQMARRGRLTLKKLRVPESDPLWAHFQFKSSTTAAAVNTQPSASSSQSVRPSSSSNPSAEDKLRGSGTSEAPKRGVSSREIKEKKKMKPKSDPKVEIQMKDESQRASVRPPPESVNESRKLSDSAKEVPPTRRQPAASSSRPSKPPVRQDVDKESVHPKASAGRAEKSASQELKKAHLESDIRASDSEKGPRRERTKTKERAPRKGSQEDEVMDSKSKSALKRKRIEDMDPVENAIRRAIEDDEYSSSKLSSKRKAKEDPDFIESKPLKRRPTEDGVIDSRVTSSKRKPKDDDKYDGPKSAVSKRKQVEADGDYYEPPRQKKLKSNRDSLSSTVSSRDERQRKEYALPKKPNPDERGTSRDNTIRPASTKTGKTSPPPALKRSATADPDHRHSSKSDSPMTAGSNGGRQTKSRRKSPVFTSSEDEKEEAPLNKQVPVQSSVVPPVDIAIEAHSMKRNKPPQTLSSDRVSLRSRYNTKYVEYLSVMQQLVVQRGKLDSMLKSADLDSSGTITDSEGDVELLPFEELESLTVGYKRLHDELEGIKLLFDDKVKEEPTSD
jgi:RNA polymerase II elongation factor ELL